MPPIAVSVTFLPSIAHTHALVPCVQSGLHCPAASAATGSSNTRAARVRCVTGGTMGAQSPAALVRAPYTGMSWLASKNSNPDTPDSST